MKEPTGGELSDLDLAGLIAEEIRASVLFDSSELADKRNRAIEYQRGEMNDTPARVNGSEVTSRDLADTISWMLPGIMRVFMSSDRMAEYEAVAPKGSNDPAAYQKAEDNADQASDYISYVFMKENDGYRIVYEATYDALLSANGIVKHFWDDTPETEMSFHTRLTAEQVAQLTEDGDVKVLASKKNKEPDLVADPMTGQATPVETYDCKIERTTSRGRLVVEALSREQFLKDKDSITIDDARFVAHFDPYMTRSRLIEMGFSKADVDELPGDKFPTLTAEASSRRPFTSGLTSRPTRSTEYIDYYECYLRVDADGDGVAEIVKVHYAGSGAAGKILDWEIWEDDIPFSDIPCYPVPHDFEAQSVADRTLDIQQIKTVLQRQALENLYASNLPMREVEEGSVLNPDILVSPKFGGIVWRKKGTIASSPTNPFAVPFVADKVFAASEYVDRILQKRTGVMEMSMGLDPEALQNQSATANQNAHDASYSQNELVARNMAELGWRRVFRALLRLIVKHQDRPRTIRLRGKFVEMDPRQWDADMDVTVNTGLGTGSRDRDMLMLNQVLTDQLAITDRFAATGFHDMAIDMVPRIRYTLIKKAESAGLRNPDQFYPEIDDKMIQAMKQQAAQKAQQPPMEMQLKQADVQSAQQIKQIDVQAQQQTEALKAQGNQVKEAAQLEGDLRKADADRETQMQMKQIDAQLKLAEISSREKIAFAQMQQQSQAQQGELGVKIAGHNKQILDEGTQGKPAKAEKHPALTALEGMQSLAQQMAQTHQMLQQQLGKPKQVTMARDQNGRIVGGTVQ